MTKFFAIIAFAIALPASNPAFAYMKCDKMDNAKKKAKCEKKMKKSLAKKRANTTPIKPSDVGAEFAYMDGANLFNSDDWYLGVKESGIKDIDAINKKVISSKGLIRLCRYAGHLNKTDKAAAKKLGGKLAPRLKNIQQELDGINKEIEKFDPNTLSGMEAIKATAALAATTVQIAGVLAEVPGALAAIGPIVGGGVDSLLKSAAGAAGDAMKQATDAANAAKDAAGQ
jgi:hypothetical protein